MILENTNNLSSGSHKQVKIRCDFGISEKCKQEYRKEYRLILKDRSYRDMGMDICVYCSRKKYSSGRNNPNCKYNINDNFFDIVDTEEKAYILGLIASDGHISSGNISIYQSNVNWQVLANVRDIICQDLPINGEGCSKLSISSKQWVDKVCNLLGITPGKKSHKIKFPNLASEELIWHFLRGYFDGDGSVKSPDKYPSPECKITTSSDDFRKAILEISPYPCTENKSDIFWYGLNCLDFLGKLYDNSKIRHPRKYNNYIDWCLWSPIIRGKGNSGQVDGIKWYKTNENAIPPYKERVSDSGYDLTLIEKIKSDGIVEVYDTGIKVVPPFGYYFDLVPRSSITKSGFILANSIGIIDRTYRGSIIVALIHIDKDKELSLPIRLVQLVPRPIVHFPLIEIPLEELDESSRGDGGFGSTGT